MRKKGSNEPSINLAVCLVRAMNRYSTYTEKNEQLDHARSGTFGRSALQQKALKVNKAQEGTGFTPLLLRLYRQGKATVPTVKSRSQPLERCNQSPTRSNPKSTVAADDSGDVFPRKLPEGSEQSLSVMWVRTAGFKPRPRGATVGDWTFG